MKALIIGATGATGSDLTQMLLADEAYDEVHIFVRKNIALSHQKLKVHIVNFDDLSSWAAELNGDVLFSALGTTLKAAGSKEQQWRVDYTYQYEVARKAMENGVPTYILVSSFMADASSRNFYLRMKGQLEDDIRALHFVSTTIMRPPSLVRKSTDRLGEKISIKLLNALNAIGLLKSIAPMKTELVAQAMISAARRHTEGFTISEAPQMRQLSPE